MLCLKTDPEQKESEHPDSNLIWNLQLMAQVMINALEAVRYVLCIHKYYMYHMNVNLYKCWSLNKHWGIQH